MSDEYISKEKISDFFDGIYDCCDLVFQPNDHPCKAEDCVGCKFHLIKDALKRGVLAIPAAPVREVVRGKWVWDYHHGRYFCSKCGAASPQEDQDGEYICRPKFCHCCGADMRAEEGGAT